MGGWGGWNRFQKNIYLMKKNRPNKEFLTVFVWDARELDLIGYHMETQSNKKQYMCPGSHNIMTRMNWSSAQKGKT